VNTGKNTPNASTLYKPVLARITMEDHIILMIPDTSISSKNWCYEQGLLIHPKITFKNLERVWLSSTWNNWSYLEELKKHFQIPSPYKTRFSAILEVLEVFYTLKRVRENRYNRRLHPWQTSVAVWLTIY
jgi:hypothetical protein